MFGIIDLPLFIVAGLMLNLVPGPDTLIVMTRTALQGWRAGSAAALGVAAGTFVHISAAAFGLSALLATSALAFTLIKYIGAAYLIYLGVSLLLKQRSHAIENLPGQLIGQTEQLHRVFLQGFMTNALNPKVALFFLAFVPQFIAPEADNKALAFILLGCIFNLNGTLWSHILVLSTTFARQRIRVGRRVSAALNKLTGILFVGFGMRLAISGP